MIARAAVAMSLAATPLLHRARFILCKNGHSARVAVCGSSASFGVAAGRLFFEFGAGSPGLWASYYLHRCRRSRDRTPSRGLAQPRRLPAIAGIIFRCLNGMVAAAEKAQTDNSVTLSPATRTFSCLHRPISKVVGDVRRPRSDRIAATLAWAPGRSVPSLETVSMGSRLIRS